MKRMIISVVLGVFFFTSLPAQQGPIDEVALGKQYRAKILSKHSVISNSLVDSVAQPVFRRLLEAVSNLPNLPYELTVISDKSLQAYVSPGGYVYVTKGMMDSVLKDNEGMWAAVLSHEISHAIKQHWYHRWVRHYETKKRNRMYARIAEAAARVGKNKTAWGTLGIGLADTLLLPKLLNRADEIEADQIGLGLMVKAGYHPDFLLSLQHRFRSMFGDDSKFAALFATHPRFTTREERTLRNHQGVLRSFERHYGSGRGSPGGPPPIVTIFGKIKTRENKTDKTAVITIPLRVRNAKNQAINMAVLFEKDDKQVRSADPLYQVSAGAIKIIGRSSFSFGALGVENVITPTSNDWSETVIFEVPSDALTDRDRKLDAKVWTQVEKSEPYLNRSAKFKVKFPKPHTRRERKREKMLKAAEQKPQEKQEQRIWTEVVNKGYGDVYYADFEAIKQHDGHVYYWGLTDYFSPSGSGAMSYKTYYQVDCDQFRYKGLTTSYFSQPMGEGPALYSSDVPDQNWNYPSPVTSNTPKAFELKEVCGS